MAWSQVASYLSPRSGRLPERGFFYCARRARPCFRPPWLQGVPQLRHLRFTHGGAGNFAGSDLRTGVRIGHRSMLFWPTGCDAPIHFDTLGGNFFRESAWQLPSRFAKLVPPHRRWRSSRVSAAAAPGPADNSCSHACQHAHYHERTTGTARCAHLEHGLEDRDQCCALHPSDRLGGRPLVGRA